MTDATTTISVRGEARHVVPPDFVVISVLVNVRDTEKQVALDRAGRAQSAVVEALRGLGGVVLTVTSVDAPLTWATRSFAAQRDEEWDERKARRHVGWRVYVPVTVTLRELTKLDEVAAAVSAVADVDVSQVHWQVDPRNPAWPVVRAAAIADAITKARDYATALRGDLTALVHVADEGLLGGAGPARAARDAHVGQRRGRGRGGRARPRPRAAGDRRRHRGPVRGADRPALTISSAAG